MRAIAVLSVLVSHAAAAGGLGDDSPGGRFEGHLNVGVAIFFVISGFLLFRPFIAGRTGGPSAPATATYAKRRVLRIYPAYWLALTLLVVVPGVTGVYGGEWAQQYALVQWLPLGDGSGCTGLGTGCGLAQTWSLVVEVTFYAVLPLYVFATSRLAAGRSASRWMWAQFALLAVLAAGSLLLPVVNPQEGPRTWVDGSFLGYWVWFGLGMAIAVASVAFAKRELPAPLRLVASHPEVPWLAALAAYVVLSLTTPSGFGVTELQGRITHLAFGVIGALILLPAVFGDAQGGVPRRFLANRAVAWLGLISYGIFLWHFVATLKLGAAGKGWGFGGVLAGTLAFSIAAAALSYYFVERPILRYKYRPLLRARRSDQGAGKHDGAVST